MARSFLLGSLLVAGSPLFACSCFGPQTFCLTLDPPYAEPEWWIPDAIIMAVKLADVEYGVDVKVVQSFHGSLQTNEVIRVWGDCGLLCRHYTNGVANGDTVMWAIQQTDLSGNFGCGTQFEQATDYQLSVCGIYWLEYDNGIVSGPLTVEGANESVTLLEFADLVTGCLSTGVQETMPIDPLVVRSGGHGTWLSLTSAEIVELTVWDAVGRSVITRSWDGLPIRLNEFTSGVCVVQVRREDKLWVRKVVP